MQKKKILYVITKGAWGGAQRYVFDLATRLPRGRFETVVAMGAGTALERKLSAAGVRTVMLQRLTETRRAGPQPTDCAAFFELLNLLTTERPDIVHLNSSRAAFLGALAARFCILFSRLRIKDKGLRIPKIIFTVHGWPFKEPRVALIRAVLWLASYMTALLAHRVIVLSEGDSGDGKRMPGISRKLSLIYNGIANDAAFSKTEARSKLGLPSDSLVIGSIAELNRNKGLRTLIEAFTELPKNMRLCLIGDGEDRAKLETFAALRGMRDRVLFTGHRDGASAFLPAFDVFALPSVKEGLPYTILEAGLQGLPVVGSDVSGVRDIINSPLVGILVPPRNPRALAAALQALGQQKGVRERLGRRLQERVHQTFSLDMMQKKTLEVYERT